MDWNEYLIRPGTTIITGAATGLVVAFFTARYALRRFYQEKWWEKRLAAFTEVIEYAYQIKRAEDYWYAQISAQRGADESFQAMSKEDEDALMAEFKLAMKELTKISYLSSFTLSENSSELLAAYLFAHNSIFPSWWEDEIDNFEATEKTSMLIDALLDNLKSEAKIALNINIL